jgi:hypothetical protein
MTSTSDELTALHDLRRDGKLIPFVGAGLSRPFGLPSWTELINEIAQLLGFDPEVFKCNGDDRQLAEYYVAIKGSIGPLRSVMDKRFAVKEESIRQSRAHSALVDMGVPLIYTTNYDEIIEQAFAIKKREFHTIANIDDIGSAPSNVTHIVKFHGTFSDDTSLVLTESSYFERLEFESAIDIKLRADTLGRSLMFIGYSLSDLNVRYLLYKLHKLRERVRSPGKRTPSAYLIAFGTGEIQRTLLARWDVSVIDLDPLDRSKSIDEFLETLV